MSLPIILLVTTVAFATLALSASIPSESAEKATEGNVETFDSYAVQKLPQQLPLTFQLPREDLTVPFYPIQPVPYLRAPQYIPNLKSNFYQVPIPSEFLTAPTEGSWNPNNDPALYYELPAAITKENTPTNQYPKKFNKDIHTKDKPVSIVPKQEIALEPINESQYVQKQKELYKTVQNLNKKENQKHIEQEQVPIRIIKPRVHLQHSQTLLKDSTPHQTKFTNPSTVLSPKSFIATTSRPVHQDESQILADSSDSGFEQDVDSESRHPDTNKLTKGTSSLGTTSNHGADGGKPERVLFHMVGHDGPMSYKWGYDTGKGQNRQFRFEEKDREGVVKGQFGFYEGDGKFKVMNYIARPGGGFHSEIAPESEIK